MTGQPDNKDWYTTKSPVLFIVFNRPQTAFKVFEAIKKARPPRLYIAADGPRLNRENESVLCEEVRSVARLVDWQCEVKTLFRGDNLGCKDAVSSAINWFFDNEEEGIILEDDCLPANSFFRFCDVMLEKYRSDTRIRHVGGSNLQDGQIRGDASYYFSNLTHVWGWAGWKRVWKDYDKELKKYDYNDIKKQLEKIFADAFVVECWVQIFKEVKGGLINTWDYQLTFLNFFNNGLSIIPNYNLISNIGFGEGATHTFNTSDKVSAIPLFEIDQITHPLYILPEKVADHYTLSHEFPIAMMKRKHNKWTRRMKRKLSALLNIKKQS